MMATAGRLADENRPARAGTWTHDQADSWADWLLPHLPAPTGWLADLGTPLPAEAEFLFSRVGSETWDPPSSADFDSALGLIGDDGASDVTRVVAKRCPVTRSKGWRATAAGSPCPVLTQLATPIASRPIRSNRTPTSGLQSCGTALSLDL
ncbi:hypothetical protein GCM10010279_26060 [Streptomyces mutabilis]|nr:hypothetical protein GCM10010279_26060 [Streptomyces mutabilis]